VRKFFNQDNNEIYVKSSNVQYFDRFLDVDMKSKIWKMLNERMAENSLSKVPVLLIGFSPREESRICDMLEQLKFLEYVTISKMPRMCEMPMFCGNEFYSLVNAELFNDTENLVEALIILREIHKNMIIVLISAFVNQDDLSNERTFICDATLRAPVTIERLKAGLLSARENTGAIQIDMTLSSPT